MCLQKFFFQQRFLGYLKAEKHSVKKNLINIFCSELLIGAYPEHLVEIGLLV